MADVAVLLFFLFDKGSCVFHPIPLSGLLHLIVALLKNKKDYAEIYCVTLIEVV